MRPSRVAAADPPVDVPNEGEKLVQRPLCSAGITRRNFAKANVQRRTGAREEHRRKCHPETTAESWRRAMISGTQRARPLESKQV